MEKNALKSNLGAPKQLRVLATPKQIANEGPPMPRISRLIDDCPHAAATRTLKALGGRWKVLLLQELMSGAKRYTAFRRALPRITPKMLAQQLQELEADGVIERRELVATPPKVVEYRLTPLGDAARPLLEAMVAWGDRYAVAHNRQGEETPAS